MGHAQGRLDMDSKKKETQKKERLVIDIGCILNPWLTRRVERRLSREKLIE